jgi:hypothetical protein
MPLSWNEIRDRAVAFSREWAGEVSEDAEAKSFWDAFFQVFGVSRRRIAAFEWRVQKIDGHDGYIDVLWKGVVMVEHKSRGKDLDRAFEQAREYFPGLKDAELPRYIIVSDFARVRLTDLETGDKHEFDLKDLHKNIKLFAFIAGYQTHTFQEQDPINVKAAEKMGRLYDRLKATGYEGHPLQVLLVRLLFCLFADDTGIFQRAQFLEYLTQRTGEDGSDLGSKLAEFFQILNTAPEKRQKTLDEQLAAFPYVNGKLFEEALPSASFDRSMRDALLDACALDWSGISPAIFGALFQSVMDEKARRNLGAHYTSEKNILKLIKPLFLDELWAEFEKVKSNKNRLFEFHKKLRTLTFLDPACGCGNFLVIAYRELRMLELAVLRAARTSGQRVLDVHHLTEVNVDQFYGIEIEEFPAQIAQVALWLMDHQMNLKVSEEFGLYFARIPLTATPHIAHGNALHLDWNNLVPKENLRYILGNPPFIGAKFMSDTQRADADTVFGDMKGSGVLDLVAAWYVIAARLVAGTKVRCAFVSTNSITQGEQVVALWPQLHRLGMNIQFAHRTFSWSNEARGVAAVHCVIIGFGAGEVMDRIIFDYPDIQGEPHGSVAKNINPYLIDGPNVMATGRLEPLCPVAPIVNGNIPADGGNLILSADQKNGLLAREPNAGAWVRPYLGGEGFLHNELRYCLWLVGCSPDDLKQMPLVLERVSAVREMRLASDKAATRAKAAIPSLFTEIRQPASGRYLAFPRTSSERRAYIPLGYLSHDVIAANDLQLVPNASLYEFGVLSSAVHNAWTRVTSGRLESRIRYSVKFTYNNFPWPMEVSAKQKAVIEGAAQRVLDARAAFPKASLAELYDPLTMPPELVKAHQALDRAVDAAYGRKSFGSDAERVAFLFEQYRKLTSLLPVGRDSKRGRKRAV